jgi:hypothetical protein
MAPDAPWPGCPDAPWPRMPHGCQRHQHHQHQRHHRQRHQHQQQQHQRHQRQRTPCAPSHKPPTRTLAPRPHRPTAPQAHGPQSTGRSPQPGPMVHRVQLDKAHARWTRQIDCGATDLPACVSAPSTGTQQQTHPQRSGSRGQVCRGDLSQRRSQCAYLCAYGPFGPWKWGGLHPLWSPKDLPPGVFDTLKTVALPAFWGL